MSGSQTRQLRATGDTPTVKSNKRVLVIGAGPAGLSAAKTLAFHGVHVDLIDENVRPGGAITRQPFLASLDRPSDVENSKLDQHITFHDRSVCHGFNGKNVVVSRAGELANFAPTATIVATGARERIRPVPGGMLAGVIACGGAQTLMKGSGHFPYQDVVVAGSGPLLLATASQLLDQGVRVRALVEESNLRNNLRPVVLLDALRNLPTQIAVQGAQYMVNILRHRVKIYSGYRVKTIQGTTGVQSVQIGSIQNTSKVVSIDCDSVVMGYGFVSASEIVQQAGARVEFDTESRYWVPTRTDAFETSISGVYSVGDCNGIQGKDVAELEGFFAAVDILRRQFGFQIDNREISNARRRHTKLTGFQRVLTRLYPQISFADIDEDSVVCQCENVTQRETTEAIEHGAQDFRSLKLWTRAGMGICQGRSCAHAIADILGTRGNVAKPPSIQFPVRPLPFRVADTL